MKQAKLTTLLLVVMMTSTFFTSCKMGKGGDSAGQDSTKTAVDSASLPDLKGDANINLATRFYAGISKEGINMTAEDSKAWDSYSKEIKRLLDISYQTRTKLDTLAHDDFSDIREKVDLVFYPFSGADFLYPITLFPNADTYVLSGLEKTGTPFSGDVKTNYAQYESYRKALSTFLRSSYFITKDMANDLDNEMIDGVCPVIAMLMATAGYEIISIQNMKFDENGKLTPSDGTSNVIQFKFFRSGSKHEQTLCYVSGNVIDGGFDNNYKKFIETTFPDHTVATYLKAASYLMHQSNFSTIRDHIVDYSQYLLEDDSGIPYRFLADKFDITLYGIYKRPLRVFTDACIQPDLDQAYKDNADKVKPLTFQIGYNKPSNLLCARRKAAK
ncbi:MAG: hypothetical protein IKQ77_09030 [Prevotella sp.]|nr:hypothetical protein [Prevotella sp.]